MRLTKLAADRRDALLVHLHAAIAAAAASTAAGLVADTWEPGYPPNGSLSDADRAARAQLGGAATEHLLTKAIADGAATALFQLFTAMDAVGEPLRWNGPWDAVHLATDTDGEDSEMLHDLFFETYWASVAR